jgi:diguanylate cyclase (GGDEF)-like protein
LLRLALAGSVGALLVLVWRPSLGLAYAAVGLELVLGLLLVFGWPTFLLRGGLVVVLLDAIAVSLLVGGTGGARSLFFPLYLLAALGLARVSGPARAAFGGAALVAGYLVAVVARAPEALESPTVPFGAGLIALSCAAAALLGGESLAARREGRGLSEALEAERRYAAETEVLISRLGPLLAVLGLDGALRWAAEAARELTGAEYAHVALLDGDRHHTAVGGGLSTYPSWWHPEVQRLVAWSGRESGALRSREAVCGMSGLAAVPITYDGQKLGALVVGGGRLDAEGERALALLAAEVAPALRSAREAPGGRDPVTGLPNRSSLYRSLERELSQGAPLAVVVVGLDRLGDYGREHGAASGDALLREVGRRLGESSPNPVYHYGGGEFAVVLKGADEARSRGAGLNLRQTVSELAPDGASPLTASVGYATVGPGEERDPVSVVDAARGALARARSSPGGVSGPSTGAEEATIGGEAALSEAVSSLLRATEARAPDLGEHSRAVACLSRRVGLRMSLPQAEVEALVTAALLHDVGKIGLPDSILHKPCPLSAAEYDATKRHPQLGARILEPVRELSLALPAVRHHHERFDGGGYPDGLKGEEIPLLARIVAAVDAYDSMIRDRPYRGGVSGREALDELLRHAGTQFDPRVVGVLAELLREESVEARGGSAG